MRAPSQRTDERCSGHWILTRATGLPLPPLPQQRLPLA
jgi:hypothetical protein